MTYEERIRKLNEKFVFTDSVLSKYEQEYYAEFENIFNALVDDYGRIILKKQNTTKFIGLLLDYANKSEYKKMIEEIKVVIQNDFIDNLLSLKDDENGINNLINKQIDFLIQNSFCEEVALFYVAMILRTLKIKTLKTNESTVANEHNSEVIQYDIEYGDENFNFEECKKSAESGYAPAIVQIGCCYYVGYGVEKDNEKAIEYFKIAADQNNATAQYMLGACYQLNKKKYSEAAQWLQKALDNGNVDASVLLGWLYIKGQGVRKNEKKGFNLFLDALKKAPEDADLLCAIGGCYLHGYGTEVNIDVAKKFFTKSLKIEENEEAFYALGECYAANQNVDYAYRNYKKAANLGHAESMHVVSLFYRNGIVVNQNDEKADYWYDKAIEAGYEPEEEEENFSTLQSSEDKKRPKTIKKIGWLSAIFTIILAGIVLHPYVAVIIFLYVWQNNIRFKKQNSQASNNFSLGKKIFRGIVSFIVLIISILAIISAVMIIVEYFDFDCWWY